MGYTDILAANKTQGARKYIWDSWVCLSAKLNNRPETLEQD